MLQGLGNSLKLDLCQYGVAGLWVATGWRPSARESHRRLGCVDGEYIASLRWCGFSADTPDCLAREARLEQKAARREAAREASPEMTKLPGGGDIMGGDDSIAAARARYEMHTLLDRFSAMQGSQAS